MSPQAQFRHYVPLLVFTALLIIAAGITSGIAAVTLLLPEHREIELPLLSIAMLSVTVGGLFSFLHLGRKSRAGRAALGLSHSWLSREAVLAGLFAAFTAGALFARQFGLSDSIFSVLLAAASATGFLTTVAIGRVYDLTTQVGWRGWAQALTPPTTVLLLGSVLLYAVANSAGFKLVFYAIWLVDVVFLGWRSGEYSRNVHMGAAFSFPALSRFVRLTYGFRKLLAIVVVVFFNSFGGLVTAAFVAVAICLDRFCLYAASAQGTPASEMAALRAERLKQAAG